MTDYSFAQNKTKLGGFKLPAVEISGQIGRLSVHLASSKVELNAAQKLRYRVFCEEMSASTGLINRITKREFDSFDQEFDHLLLHDMSNPDQPIMIGTQRFQVLTNDSPPVKFYSSQEFEISTLLACHPGQRFMELGRSCILSDYRDKRTMELLWHGTWDYALKMKTDVMFGCASIPGKTIEDVKSQLSALALMPTAQDDWDVLPKSSNAIDLRDIAKSDQPDRAAIRRLPPLIKGYLRLGAMFSRHVVFDPKFKTFDVLVILPVATINPKYVSHYGANADRHRAH